MNPEGIPQFPPLLGIRPPILSVGAGGIVRDAHQPACRKAGFPGRGPCLD